MPHALRDLIIDEVSLVDEPANEGARVLLWKRRASSDSTQEEQSEMAGPQQLAWAVEINKAADYSRDEYFVALEKHAETLPGRTAEARMSAALATEVGRLLYNGYRQVPVAKAAVRRPTNLERQAEEEAEARKGTSAYAILSGMAEDAHRRDPSRSFQWHMEDVTRKNPELREQYREDQRGGR